MGRARHPTDEHPRFAQDQRRRRPHAAFVPLSRGRGLHGPREHGRGGELRLPKLGWSPTRPPSRRPTLISRPRSGARKTRRQAPCLFVFEGNELARYSLTRETEIGQDRFGLSTHVLSALRPVVALGQLEVILTSNVELPTRMRSPESCTSGRAGGLICEPLKAVWPAYAGIVTRIFLVDRASYLLSLVPLCTLESGLHPAPPLTRNSPSPKSSAPQSSSPDP